MDQAQVEAMRAALMRRRPTVSRTEDGMSRRLEDEVTQVETDTRGFASVLCYIQRGLGDEGAAIREVLNLVLRIQKPGRHRYPVCHFAFGTGDADLHHDRATRHTADAKTEAELLCALAGPGPVAPAPLLVDLWSKTVPFLPAKRVGPQDLLVFFCRDRGVRLSETAQRTYSRFKRHALWIFINGGQVEWELGSFAPAVEPAAPTPPVAVAAPPAAPAQPMAKTLDEHAGKRWQTTALSNAAQTAIDRLKSLAAIVATHFIPRDWVCRANKGSLTFQHPTEKHMVVCLFVDVGSALLKDSGIVAEGSIDRETALLQIEHVVLAAELTELPPHERRSWREELRRRCGRMYCDPEVGFSKYWLAPNKGHLFDVAFFGVGECDLEADPDVAEQINALMRAGRGTFEGRKQAVASEAAHEAKREADASGAAAECADESLTRLFGSWERASRREMPRGQVCDQCKERPATTELVDTWIRAHRGWVCDACSRLSLT